MENMEENKEKIWKIRKKNKLNREKWNDMDKYGTKASWIVKRYEKYGRKARRIVIRYGQYGRKVGWNVKWYGQYGRKASWKDMKNMEEKQVE